MHAKRFAVQHGTHLDGGEALDLVLCAQLLVLLVVAVHRSNQRHALHTHAAGRSARALHDQHARLRAKLVHGTARNNAHRMLHP